MKRLPLLAAILCLGTSVYALIAYTLFAAGTTVHPQMKLTYSTHLWLVYPHVFASLIALGIAPFQLSKQFRSQHLLWHKRLGKVYLMSVLIGGVASLGMAVIAYGGLISHIGFGLLACSWLFTAYKAYVSILNKDVMAHQRWMWVNVSLSFAAVTLRIYIGLFSAMSVPFDTFYPLLAWLCWVPNVLLMEWFILKKLGLKQ